MDMPKKTHKDYKSQESMYRIGALGMRLLGIEKGGKRWLEFLITAWEI